MIWFSPMTNDNRVPHPSFSRSLRKLGWDSTAAAFLGFAQSPTNDNSYEMALSPRIDSRTGHALAA